VSGGTKSHAFSKPARIPTATKALLVAMLILEALEGLLDGVDWEPEGVLDPEA
jgi:hypothetical protein